RGRRADDRGRLATRSGSVQQLVRRRRADPHDQHPGLRHDLHGLLRWRDDDHDPDRHDDVHVDDHHYGDGHHDHLDDERVEHPDADRNDGTDHAHQPDDDEEQHDRDELVDHGHDLDDDADHHHHDASTDL